MREKEIINNMEKENRLFDGNGEHYGIYQLKNLRREPISLWECVKQAVLDLKFMERITN